MFKKGEIILGLTLFVLFVAFLQTNYCYHFYYMEQIQLFLFNAQWAEDVLLQPGGVSLWLSRFMVQFFVVPWAGSIIISILLYGVWWSTKKGIAGPSKSMQTSLLSLFSVVSLYPVIIDPNYFCRGLLDTCSSYSFLLAIEASQIHGAGILPACLWEASFI